MSIFNSLGSNYTLKFALLSWRAFFFPNLSAREELKSKLSEMFGGKVYLFYKGRDAIEYALRAYGLACGDKVITQAFTCWAVEEAIVRSGAEPVFCDLAVGSLNPSVETLQACFDKNSNIKAVIIQHMLGHCASIKEIARWCRENNLILIEDLAQSFGGVDQEGVILGTYGDAVILSFGRDKILDAVSGGALILKDETKELSLDLPLPPFKETIKDHFYPMLTFLIRRTFDFGIGKVLLKLSRITGLIQTPLAGVSYARDLPNQYAQLALFHIACLKEQIAHRQEIYKIYQEAGLRFGVDFPSSYLRFPMWVDDPTDFGKKLSTFNFHITDRWYRQAVDIGTLSVTSRYQNGSCPKAEELASHIVNLPTHINISTFQAQQLVFVIKNVLLKQSGQNTGRLAGEGSLEVRKIDSKEVWEGFIATQSQANFLQSWNWGVFHQKMGHQVHYLGLFHNGRQIGDSLCVVENARRGRYLTIAGGPIINASDFNQTMLGFFIQNISRIAKEEGCVFIRLRPQDVDLVGMRNIYRAQGLIKAPMHVTADLTWQVDLSSSQDELLKQMRKTTRYEIRRGEKLGLSVKTSSNPEDLEGFYHQQLYLAKKHKFVPFSKKFLTEQFKAFVADNQALLFHTYQNSQLLASAFIIFYNREAVYHYGVSTPANEKLPGSQFCLWLALLEAKRRGCTRFNFWGVAPENDKNHRFAGVGLFKRGFGGREVAYVPALDLPLSWRYWLVYIFENIRRLIRGL